MRFAISANKDSAAPSIAPNRQPSGSHDADRERWPVSRTSGVPTDGCSLSKGLVATSVVVSLAFVTVDCSSDVREEYLSSRTSKDCAVRIDGS